ncbi:hypothetical protein CDD83_592 [Cordyceps sp. RAO-2017]|nr:hypothetical protein CDD83_592 [Cordyceps sp. RAO-2017]
MQPSAILALVAARAAAPERKPFLPPAQGQRFTELGCARILQTGPDKPVAETLAVWGILEPCVGTAVFCRGTDWARVPAEAPERFGDAQACLATRRAAPGGEGA